MPENNLLSYEQLKALAEAVGRGYKNPSFTFSLNKNDFSAKDAEQALQIQLQCLCGYDPVKGECDYHTFERNIPTVCSLIETAISTATPKSVVNQYERFCEFKTFGYNQEPTFYQRTTNASRRRALTFISRGAKAGVYDTFRLEGRDFRGRKFTITAGSEMTFEDFITNRRTFAELMSVVEEGRNKRLQEVITEALVGAVKTLQTANKHAATGFVATEFQERLSIADSYGSAPSTIVCTKAFANKLGASVSFDAMSDRMKEEFYANGGFLGMYTGRYPIVVLDQSYTDETNTVKEINDGVCYILPNTASDSAKPIKLGTVGGPHVKYIDNQLDWSLRFDMFQEYAIAIVVDNDICAYIDLSLLPAGQTASDYGIEE